MTARCSTAPCRPIWRPGWSATDAPGRSAPAWIEREFRRYLDCGILANGFARARCIDCGHDFLNAALHIFLHAVEQSLRLCSPGATPESRIGAVVFIHRFGGLLNPHLHFHAIVVDGVFAAGATQEVGFREAQLDPNALEKIHAQVRQRLLSTFVRRGLIEKNEVPTMLSWEHGGGFSLDADHLVYESIKPSTAILIVTGTDQAPVPTANRVALLEFDD